MSNKLTYKKKYKGGGILHLNGGGDPQVYGNWQEGGGGDYGSDSRTQAEKEQWYQDYTDRFVDDMGEHIAEGQNRSDSGSGDGKKKKKSKDWGGAGPGMASHAVMQAMRADAGYGGPPDDGNYNPNRPVYDWGTVPKKEDYDFDQDGNLNESEQEQYNSARRSWELGETVAPPTPPTPPDPYANDPTRPVKQPDEDDDSFSKRFLDWISGLRIKIGFPFPGGGNDGRFPFPIPPIFRGGGGGGGGGGTTPPTPPTPPVQPPPVQPPADPPPVEPPPVDPPVDPPPVDPPVDPPVEPDPPPDDRVIDDDSENTTPIYIDPWPSPPSGGSQPPGGPIVSNPKDATDAADQATKNIISDPRSYYIPKSLAQIDSRYADQQYFLPSGQKTTFPMNYEGVKGMQYANYGGVNRGEGGLLPLIIDLLLLLVEVTLEALVEVILEVVILEVVRIPVVETPCLMLMTG